MSKGFFIAWHGSPCTFDSFDFSKLRDALGMFFKESSMVSKLKFLTVHNDYGTPYIDEMHKFSNNGYVSDCIFMGNHIKLLPCYNRI